MLSRFLRRRSIGALAAAFQRWHAVRWRQSGAGHAGPSTPTSPLAIHVGDADLLIGGFMDMTSITRSTNTGNGIGTSFGSIPFQTTTAGAPNPAGNLNETRFSAQNSRLTLQGTSKVGSASLKGYLEVDFLGNTSTNLNVTSNSNALRMRLYWVQFTSGKFEFMGGQSWSMMTPGRNGISPVPGDLFYSQDVDTNYQNGLVWGRTPGFRFIAHASSTVTAGLGIENPEQYVGSAVVLPAAFPAAEVDTGASNLGASSPVPNVMPDIIGKIAFDPKTGKLHQHIDAAFLVRGYKTYNPTTDTAFSSTATGGSFNVVLEPVKNFRLVGTSFFSNGGGRYIANANLPDFIVNPDGSMSLVKSWSFIVGAGDSGAQEDADLRLLQPGAGRPEHGARRKRHDGHWLRRPELAVGKPQGRGRHVRPDADALPRSEDRRPAADASVLIRRSATPFSVPADGHAALGWTRR